MHVGIQTLPWGLDQIHLKSTLAEIHAAGYAGVEFAQPPQLLGTAKELERSLKRNQLQLLGLAGGPLKSRLDFLREWLSLGKKSFEPYLYLDEWSDTGVEEEALRSGAILAIHPHMFKPIQSAAEAENLISRLKESERSPMRLEFLPDTAHLTVAAEPVVAVIARNLHRTRAVHIKDWKPEFGRSYQFYSRGFVPLGNGDVPLDEVIGCLKSERFRGWLIVEQDFSETPFEDARRSREFLRSKGV